MPMEYWTASRDFDALLGDLRDTSMLATHNQAYHTLRAVLHVFRSHLALDQAVRFAEVLPPVVRAIYVEGWDPSAEVAPFPDRAALAREVQAVRRDHNTAPDSAIGDVARVLRRHADPAALDRALASLPAAARDFWAA